MTSPIQRLEKQDAIEVPSRQDYVTRLIRQAAGVAAFVGRGREGSHLGRWICLDCPRERHTPPYLPLALPLHRREHLERHPGHEVRFWCWDCMELEERFEANYGTLQEQRRISEKFPEKSRRLDFLTWAHHQVVAAREDAADVLAQAEREGQEQAATAIGYIYRPPNPQALAGEPGDFPAGGKVPPFAIVAALAVLREAGLLDTLARLPEALPEPVVLTPSLRETLIAIRERPGVTTEEIMAAVGRSRSATIARLRGLRLGGHAHWEMAMAGRRWYPDHLRPLGKARAREHVGCWWRNGRKNGLK